MAGSQVSAGSLAPDDDHECHHRKTDDPGREGADREREREREKERQSIRSYNIDLTHRSCDCTVLEK